MAYFIKIGEGKNHENDPATVMAEMFHRGDADGNEKLEHDEFVKGMYDHPVTRKILEIKTIDGLIELLYLLLCDSNLLLCHEEKLASSPHKGDLIHPRPLKFRSLFYFQSIALVRPYLAQYPNYYLFPFIGIQNMQFNFI